MLYKRSDQVKVKKVGNETALFIWETLQERFTFDELLYMLGEVFEGDTTEMKDDLHETLNLFLRYNLVYTET